jgi:solute carrier family 45 protein 1/2/4
MAYTPLIMSSNEIEPQSLPQHQHLYNPHRSTFYIIILTLIVGALQLAWSTEFSEATPFLLSLGISKKVLSLVWLAGPLSGTIGQPIVGMLSDKCTLKYGKRRIFILIGCILTSSSLILLSRSKEIINFIFKPFNLNDENIKFAIIFFACIGIYILDFSIAIIQASSRALIVDVVSTEQQQIANAWAARMIGIFNLIGFWIGTLNLIKLFPFLGNTQFKNLSTLVAIIMFTITCFCLYYIEERNPQTDLTLITQRKLQDDKLKEMGIDPNSVTVWNQLINFFKAIICSFKTIPPQVKIVCYAQLFAWIGYFPLLFYTTSYVGELYLYEKGYPNPSLIPPDLKQDLLDQSTRVGTYALLSNAIITLLIVSFLPSILEKYQNERFNLRDLWIYSHIIFIICTFFTFFIKSYKQAILLFAFTGIPWGCAVWIPFTLISEEISRIKDIKAIQIYFKQQSENLSIIEDDAPNINNINSIYCKDILIHYYNNLEYDSGLLLALHNVFVSAPQMLSSFMASILFTILHKSKTDNSYDPSLGWIFRFGGLMTIGAWYISKKVKTNEELYDNDKLMAISSEF